MGKNMVMLEKEVSMKDKKALLEQRNVEHSYKRKQQMCSSEFGKGIRKIKPNCSEICGCRRNSGSPRCSPPSVSSSVTTCWLCNCYS